MGIGVPVTGSHPRPRTGLRRRLPPAVPRSYGGVTLGIALLLVAAWALRQPGQIIAFGAAALVIVLSFLSWRPADRTVPSAIVLVGAGSNSLAMMAALGVPPIQSVHVRASARRREARSTPAVIHVPSLGAAASLIPQIACDRLVLMDPVTPTWAPPADVTGRVPRTTSSVDQVSRVLGRLPLELLPLVPDIRSGVVQRPSRREAFLKRSIDLAISIPAAILLAPLLPFVALVIQLDSRGSIFYTQTRVGLGGGLFRIYKFRSMRRDAEPGGAVWADSDDCRVTRVGRMMRATRIDELPQLWNVIRGDMSLVGPRPERPEFTELLEQEFPGFRFRTRVRPGLTGWAQICAGYSRSVRDARTKLEYDLFYVTHGSILFDLRILLRTIPFVIARRGS